MNSPKKIIGVDIDDVVFGFNEALGVWHNRLHGTSYERKDIVSYEFEGLWQCTYDEVRQRVADFYQSDEHYVALPIPGAIEGLHELKKKNTLVAVSARPEAVRGLTVDWLCRNGAINVFDAIHFLGHHHEPGERKVSKAEICKEVGIEIFIDDSLVHATTIAWSGVPVLLLDTPWNQAIVPDLVTRVYSWDEILEKAL